MTTITTSSRGVALISAERDRQPAEEGYTAEHDRGHASQLAAAGAAYAGAGRHQIQGTEPGMPFLWPWNPSFWKPGAGAVRTLVKAGALIAAAIDSLLAEEES